MATTYKFNPYTFARISAMKSLLLQKADYDRLMKMYPNEIIKFLQDGVYNKEINELAIKYSGIKLMEAALNKHLIRIFDKLKVITDPNTRFLMNQYLKRYDFWNIKTIIRGKLTGEKEEVIIGMLLPAGSIKLEKLKELAQKSTVRGVLESSKLVNIPEDPISRFENTKDLSEIENLLDFHYYIDTVEFAETIPEQGKLFHEFFLYEFDIYNIKLMLKRIVFKLEKSHVEPYIIYQGKHLKKSRLKALLKAENLSEFIREISNTPYSNIIKELGVEEPLLRYEIMLEHFLLEKALLLYHQHPLTVDIVLGYMFAKEIEIQNLRTIMKSRMLEFTEDYVKELIVV